MYEKIYVPVDNSEHSMRSIELAMHFAKKFKCELVGCHAYAARMHDVRFKQMEFTLPSEYQVEEELEKQRSIHDTLITMGLELISDSYLEVMKLRCAEAKLPFEAKMIDGRNYKVLVDDIKNSDYDLVVMGALGLGAVKDSMVGSVCERVLRRTKTDTLVVKNTSSIIDQLQTASNGNVKHSAGTGGNIIVCVDGSPESFAGLKSALKIGHALNKEVEAIAVYDPYLHYTLFNSIANVLTEKASKVFKFKEQEKLHEDIIDTGLAKIYQSHLEIARTIALEENIELKITLLDGKAFEKIIQYVRREQPWLLVLGRVGVHSDEDMDLGSNSENLLRLAPCNILFSSQRYTPSIDLRAEETMVWTEDATALLNTAPEGVRGIAKTTIHRWAMERGHSVISRKVIEKAMAPILPPQAMKAMGIIAEDVAVKKIKQEDSETYICKECGYAAKDVLPVKCPICKSDSSFFNKIDKKLLENMIPLEGGIEQESTFDGLKLNWTSESKQALRSVPSGYQRRRSKAQIEKTARVRKLPTITKELVMEIAGDVMEQTEELQERGRLKLSNPEKTEMKLIEIDDFLWTQQALDRLNRVPEGFMREGTKKRMEDCARGKKLTTITLEIAEEGIKDSLKAMEEMIAKQSASREKGQNKNEIL
jgi:nucleotide-binding universal stress UspA family protein